MHEILNSGIKSSTECLKHFSLQQQILAKFIWNIKFSKRRYTHALSIEKTRDIQDRLF